MRSICEWEPPSSTCSTSGRLGGTGARSSQSTSIPKRLTEPGLTRGAAFGVAPELADPVGPLEVGEHEDVEKLGAGSRTEGVQACP
jgi:hypothetical protein